MSAEGMTAERESVSVLDRLKRLEGAVADNGRAVGNNLGQLFDRVKRIEKTLGLVSPELVEPEQPEAAMFERPQKLPGHF